MSKKKKAARKVARRAAAPKKQTSARLAPSRWTTAATIFVYDVNGECRVRTSPQVLAAADGIVEWTVVNLTSHEMPDVEITFPKGSPWGGQPIPIKGGNARVPLSAGKAGTYKYNVTCNGYTEDPELEYPVN